MDVECSLSPSARNGNCQPYQCKRCGWNKAEAAARRNSIEKDGLTQFENGLRGLKLQNDGEEETRAVNAKCEEEA